MKKTLILLLITAVLIPMASAQQDSYSPTDVRTATYFRKSPPLREMTIVLPGERDRSWKDDIIPNEIFDDQVVTEHALPAGSDPVAQQYMGKLQHKGPHVNIAGIRNVNGVAPPDTDGDVGPDHYFQMINLSFAIWDKQGNKLYGPVDNSTLWSGFIGPWTGTNDGDPILLYDQEADRWMASQFAIHTANNTYWELIAISETGDPLGAWYQYAFEFPAFNDYPHFGIWHDGYYATFNMFGEYYRGAAAAFERDKMLVGDSTAQMVLFDMPEFSDQHNMLPADFDGPEPPEGTPNYFINFKDDAWGYASDRLVIWEFVPDWDDPFLSVFQEIKVLDTEPFQSFLCDGPRWQCIDQPNTGTKLEALNDRLMFRLQFRNFDTYHTMVCNHTVNADGYGQAGIRWYELRDSLDGNGWQIFQQGTYAPDGFHRWMASVAMNGYGTIAMGYTVSGSHTVFPSIRYTGRHQDAPLGEMSYEELEVIPGTGSQTNLNRWGDYSMTSVDPVDDSTFWHTNEWSAGGWQTRIFSFDFGPVNPPAVDLGNDTTIMEDKILHKTASANNYHHVLWETDGDGVILGAEKISISYLRGEDDILSGSLNLWMTAWGYLPELVVVDSMVVYIERLPTGIVEEAADLSVNVFPNPVHDKFRLEISGMDQSDLELVISNNQGQVIFSYLMDSFNGSYTNDIDMSYFPAGIYFLSVRGGAVNETVKIIKQ